MTVVIIADYQQLVKPAQITSQEMQMWMQCKAQPRIERSCIEYCFSRLAGCNAAMRHKW